MSLKERKPADCAPLPPTPIIIPFPRPKPRPNRLTILDLQEAEEWASGLPSLWCKLVIYESPPEDEEIGDFISIYKLGQSWASWGAARRGASIVLWRADCGSDLGIFSRMRDALEAILPSARL
jgi:hypothetical protein